jgi:uncharacterized protein YchJ
MATLPIDAGTPIPALDDASERALLLATSICARPAGLLLHLDAVEGVRGARVDHESVDPQDHLHFHLDVSTGGLEALDPRSRAYVESERGAWFPRWLERSEARMQSRFDHLDGQLDESPPDARPAPAWEPATCVPHDELYPWDFAPALTRRDGLWLIADAACADPGCPCEDVSLLLFGPKGERVEVVGELGERRPRRAEPGGRALWEALHEDEQLLEELRVRRVEIRAAGPFIVGAAYEQARLAKRKDGGRPVASDDPGGYLQGGAVPVALVRRLFNVCARLHAARITVQDAWRGPFRVEATGAITREGWGEIDEEQWGFYLQDAPYADQPWLELMIVPRGDVSMDHRRQRLALGLPLLGGTALPMVSRVGPGFALDAPDADDVRLAVAVGEAILAATPGLVERKLTAPRVFEHRVELPTCAVDVRLTASHADAPWADDDDAQGEDVGVDDLDDDDLDDGEAADDDRVEATLEAFTDAALDAGLAPDVVSAARTLVLGLGTYAAEHHERGRWFDEDCFSRFLEDYGPRKVMLTAAEIDLAPDALYAVADWLGEVGHADARRLRFIVERALPAFRKKARDPRFFAPAKALFSEMRDAGVDVHDQAAIEAFVDAKNAGAKNAGEARREEGSGKEAVSRSPARWQPAPGQRPPAPADPCGCGSGRRYKKCCMPR